AGPTSGGRRLVAGDVLTVERLVRGRVRLVGTARLGTGGRFWWRTGRLGAGRTTYRFAFGPRPVETVVIVRVRTV
ncbi:MAG TPA: hypothetical protein VMD59_05990, partial [Acidimicrobiales bacterium]|nr:hypothetical protein [Acidimicrobiales bacterium]